ncbi:Protein-S-isoprenylcysteine O-methyltransferase [Rhynchospora pubera]|uniref:Protein-S-isoprenylcysteine O-methyltransferase n=1 Tax=Rhynchospora pubera TaxID=906938 RepID=A0AAV8HJT9_9POAL|nr:Protein-S-isoprenylcysteine O-methyltransferase [Rhynchospora pubera]
MTRIAKLRSLPIRRLYLKIRKKKNEENRISLSLAFNFPLSLTTEKETIDLIRRILLEMEDALTSYTAIRQISQFVGAVLFFHVSEYLLAIYFHGRSNVSCSSLLISKHYVIAMAFALIEYIVEITLIPQWKENWFLSNCGLVMILVGEVIRKVAIVTAGRAFTHMIRIYYEEHHELITHGIYSIMRHPSYCGFFIWAIGTQVMLRNPISLIAFVLVMWRFFFRRIPYPMST